MSSRPVHQVDRFARAFASPGQHRLPTRLNNITPRQAELISCIRSFKAERGMSPTHAELVPLMGLRFENAIKVMIDRLVAAGVILTIPGRARCLYIVEDHRQSLVG